MELAVYDSVEAMEQAAAAHGAKLIAQAIEQRGEANIIVATGASQMTMLSALTQTPDMPWHRITGFHLDEYIGLPITHGASFRRYLWERFVSRLPLPLKAFHYLDGEGDAKGECRRVGQILAEHAIDVAFVGIGENAHLAFNDPPADFETTEPYLVVDLDEACRHQQLGEGWFPSLEAVPRQAISMSVRQIMRSEAIVCTVPDERKAQAVRDAVEGPVSTSAPASILQQHEHCRLFLDAAAASMLSQAAGQTDPTGGNRA